MMKSRRGEHLQDHREYNARGTGTALIDQLYDRAGLLTQDLSE
jgi:hypothetical protein